MEIPSRIDWGDIDENDLDTEWAFKQFFGKSFDEAESLFQDHALYYQEDLQSMPFIPFNFYAPALAKYIISERAKGDSDGASSFLHLIVLLLKTRRDIISRETEQLLVDASDSIDKDQKFYDADVDIYGHFSYLTSEIKRLCRT
ncbi:MAG: hypothetical protein ABFS08_06820 [Pseudomonadota bacterium]